MLRGGVADKLGNAYEALWTVNEALGVLTGQADEIRIEPFNEDAAGLEFRITSGGANVWHQCKSRRNDGRWTIPNLTSAGVLDAFARKLVLPNDRVVFVSSDPAEDFERLAELAHLTDTPDRFFDTLNENDQTNFLKLPLTWPQDLPTRHAWLKRVQIETVSAAFLRRHLLIWCRLLFTTDADTVLDRLAGYLDAKTTQTITAAQLRADVESLGLGWQARLDPTLADAITDATDTYLRSLPKLIPGGEIPTPQVAAAVQDALSSSGRLTMVSGGAGSGKSVALAKIARDARTRGWPVLALRIDQFLDRASSAEVGGALLGRERSPVALLGNSVGGADCVLIIDQVDAVSERSGRSGRIREVLFELIEEARFYPSLRLVLAARRYDLDHDSRLKDLEVSDRTSAIALPALDWTGTVKPLLDSYGCRADDFTAQQRSILEIPVNLQLYVTLIAAGERLEGDLSGVILFDRLVELRAREFAAAGVIWTPQAALGSLARWMSRAQELAAPSAVLADLPRATDLLASAGLVVQTGERLQFAHESFFDHSFSADFVSRSQPVCELLRSAEQGLFRRTQVRQIFARLRAQGGRIYLANLREVMDAADVRYLVKDAVATWMGAVEAPTPAELAVVDDWYGRGGICEVLARLVLNGRAWLPLLLESDYISRLIDRGDAATDLAFWLLKKGSVDHQKEVAQFLRCWWGGRPDRLAELRQWFARLYPDGDLRDLADVYRDVVAAIPDQAVAATFEQNFDLGAWLHHDRKAGAQVLMWWLERWLTAFPNDQPFSRHGDSNWRYWLKDLFVKDPQLAILAVWPAFVAGLSRDQRALAEGKIFYSELRPPFVEDGSDWVTLIGNALVALSATAPEVAAALLEDLPNEGELALKLQLDAVAANGKDLHGRLAALIERPEVFDIGESGGKWRPFALAARSAFPFLSVEARGKLEKQIMALRPELAFVERTLRRADGADAIDMARNKEVIKSYLSETGQTEWAILSTLGPKLLSGQAQSRLAELSRKFKGTKLPEAYGVRGGFVRSPIDSENAVKMSNAHWLKAMARYAGGERHTYLKDGVIGGAEQLSALLQGQATACPARFVMLMEAMPVSSNLNYVRAIMRGVRESPDGQSVAVRLFHATARWDRDELESEICWLARKYPSVALEPGCMALLISAAVFGDASDSHVRTTKPREPTQIRDLFDGGDLEMSGLNSKRGAAWEALGTVLWEFESTLPQLQALLEKRIEDEPLTSVRMCMYHAINSVVKYDADAGIDLLRRLALKDPRSLQSRHGRHVSRWANWNRPEAMSPVLDALIATEDERQEALGMMMDAVRAIGDESDGPAYLAEAGGNSLQRRVCAFVASGNLRSDRIGDAAAIWLTQLFKDSDDQVRAEASHVAWEALLDGVSDRTDLVRAYLSSETFSEHPDRLIYALGERADRYPTITYDAIRRVLALKDEWAAKGTGRHAGSLYRLGQTLVTLYRACQGDEVREAHLLDLFDDYLAADLHDVREEIGQYERL